MGRSVVSDLRGVKLFQDGVVESYTAAMLAPYRDAEGAITEGYGASLFEPERLRRIVGLLDANGFQVHIHALGDRAVRESLDALEAASALNGRRDARHHLAHVQFADAADLPRFGALGVVANVTPYWAVLSGYVVDLTLPFVSPEAGEAMYPFGSILRHGGRLAFGSDWAVSTPDPLLQLEVAVTRRRPGRDDDEALPPSERLTLEEAIAAATMGSAYVNHRDHDTGSIEPGKLADLVVLDRDLLDRGAGAIGEARVDTTLVEGVVVYGRLLVADHERSGQPVLLEVRRRADPVDHREETGLGKGCEDTVPRVAQDVDSLALRGAKRMHVHRVPVVVLGHDHEERIGRHRDEGL